MNIGTENALHSLFPVQSRVYSSVVRMFRVIVLQVKEEKDRAAEALSQQMDELTRRNACALDELLAKHKEEVSYPVRLGAVSSFDQLSSKCEALKNSFSNGCFWRRRVSGGLLHTAVRIPADGKRSGTVPCFTQTLKQRTCLLVSGKKPSLLLKQNQNNLFWAGPTADFPNTLEVVFSLLSQTCYSSSLIQTERAAEETAERERSLRHSLDEELEKAEARHRDETEQLQQRHAEERAELRAHTETLQEEVRRRIHVVLLPCQLLPGDGRMREKLLRKVFSAV
jgi:hypothetical protein